MRIDLVDPDRSDGIDLSLAHVLVDCVAGGASVGFLEPLDVEHARHWWSEALRGKATLTWVAR